MNSLSKKPYQAFVIVISTNGNVEYNCPARTTSIQEINKAAVKANFNE